MDWQHPAGDIDIYPEILTIDSLRSQLCLSFDAVACGGARGYAHILEDLQGRTGIVESEEEACGTESQ
jgi:hypothetical protein